MEIWQPGRRWATGELEVEFKFQRRSWMLSFLFLPRRHRAPESLLPGLVIILQQASPSFSDMGVPPRGSEQFMDGWSETGTKQIHKKCFIYSKLIIVSSTEVQTYWPFVKAFATVNTPQ